MTLDNLAKQASVAVLDAVAGVVAPPLRRRRVLRGRTLIAIVVLASTPPVAALVQSVRNDDPQVSRRISEDEEPTEADGERVRTPAPDATPGSRAVGARATSSPPPSPSSMGPVIPVERCRPLITDTRDFDDPAVDIVSSDVTYDEDAGALTFVHVMDDIPSRPLPGETLVYIVDFDWDGLTYHVQVNSIPTAEEQYFVQRESRTNSWPRGAGGVTDATGSIDRAADTVTIRFDIDAFNSGERELAAEEQLPPAAPLEVGSTLTHVRLRAYPYAAGTAPYDTASGCDYVMGE